MIIVIIFFASIMLWNIIALPFHMTSHISQLRFCL